MRSTATTSALLAKPFLHILQPLRTKTESQTPNPPHQQTLNADMAVLPNHPNFHNGTGAQIQNISQHCYWAYPIVYTHTRMNEWNQ